MFQTSNIVYQNVYLTDDFKIGLEYDNHRGLLNIILANTDNRSTELPFHINILSNQYKECELTLKNNEYFLSSTELQDDLENEITDFSYGEDDEPKICIELSNIYVYDLFDESEDDLSPAMITSSSSSPLLFSSSLSSSSSCFDEPTIDNDDGYSTHSLDDTEQQQQQQQQSSISISPSKMIIPFISYQHFYSIEQNILSIRRLIEQVIWLNPFKKTVKQMMNNHLFD
ncbi:unnamed protein product [Rotaria socialis]|uniref:Uncharacterized protein n=3 Tax=Rotaria socialis TaxID=392032 RepID=A0A820KPB6_9BILA|nr:unnamed protein product [Rotaria socialis]CAF4343264.1 unnamed protein product [Rotaria socialis]